MLPVGCSCVGMTSGKVHSRPVMGWEMTADGSADPVAVGSGHAERRVRPLRAHAGRRGTDELPDRPVGRRGTARPRNRVAGSAWAGSSAPGVASFSGRGFGRLDPRKAPGRALEITPAWLAELQRVIDLDPHTVAVPSAVWTTRLLSAYLERVTGHATGIETVRIHLHRLGYVCKRPTWSMKRKSTEQAGWIKN